jgi:hypothetical protein
MRAGWLIKNNADTSAVLPPTVQNSNIACLVLGTDICRYKMVLINVVIDFSGSDL